MADAPQAETTQVEKPQEGPATAETSTSAADDPLAALTAKVEAMAGLHKELQGERIRRGKAEAALRQATGENADEWLEAVNTMDAEKAVLVEQGYSQVVIDTLAANPKALRELAKNAPRPKDDIEAQLAAAQAELAALKANPDTKRKLTPVDGTARAPASQTARPTFDPRGGHVRQLAKFVSEQTAERK